MNTAEWQQVKSILDRVLEAAPDARERILNELCAGDAALYGEVKDLLGFTERAENLLPENGIAAAFSSDAERGSELPKRAGPYRILREIGYGGMGVVYLAERDDGQYERLVALKLIGAGAHRAKFAKLFWRERQILARLDHPNIARLLDGGTTESGQPYYAMEFVEGEPLDRYCERHSCSVREKLDLFISICSAVSYAHGNLIIHRDLKPKNVLVTQEGVPKLLDFGVARILANDSELETTTGLPLTPLYASPEQIRGEPLTVATDIYSLGVLLYELLSGHHPFGQRETAPAAFRAILDEAPIPLSQQAPGIPSDLENIVMMAIRKESWRRYATVDALCKDIQNFVAGFPVHASPDTFLYRSSKFAKRHRWSLLAATLALLGITVSGVIVWREKQQAWLEKQEAEMRFQQVRQLAKSVVFELHDAIEDLPGSSRARQLLIARGLEYLNALVKNRGRDPGLSFELAQAYMKIGAAQGDLEQANIGDREGALTSYTKARNLLTDLHRQDLHNRDIERALALVDNDIAVLAPRARVQDAVEIRKEAVLLFEDIARSSSGIQGMKDAALAHFYLAFSETEEQKFSEALPIWNEALSEYTKIAQLDNRSLQSQRNVALIEKHIAGVYYALGKYDSSLAHARSAAAIDQARVTADPQSPSARMDLSFDLVELGWALHELRHEKQAVDNLNRAILLRRQVAAADPNDFRAQSELETVLRIAGVIRCQAGSLGEAIALVREASEIGASLHARDTSNTDETVNFALDSLELGNAYRSLASKRKIAERANWQSALDNFRQSQRLVKSIPRTAFEDPNDRDKVARLPEKISECLQHTRS